MWLRNCWHVAGFSSEVSAGGFLARRLLNEPVVIWRGASGALSALQDRCVHRLVPLSAGKVVGNVFQCGYHGIQFKPTGECAHIPGQDTIPGKARVRSYPLVDVHNLLWIWMGDAELADPDLVPDVHWMDDPNWVPSTGYHHVKADFRLLGDNLLDLSHETYIHEKTIGDDVVAQTPVHVDLKDDLVVRAHRNMANIPAPPFFEMVLKPYQGRIDRWQTATFLPPGIHLTQTGVMPAGSDPRRAHQGRVMHLLTPETEKSTHYFWGMARNYKLDDSELTDLIRQAVSATFDEDTVLLELQQAGIDEQPDTPLPNLAIRLDAAPMQARRLIEALIMREKTENGVVRYPRMADDAPVDLVAMA